MEATTCVKCGVLKPIPMNPRVWVMYQKTPAMCERLKLCEDCTLKLEQFLKKKGDD